MLKRSVLSCFVWFTFCLSSDVFAGRSEVEGQNCSSLSFTIKQRDSAQSSVVRRAAFPAALETCLFSLFPEEIGDLSDNSAQLSLNRCMYRLGFVVNADALNTAIRCATQNSRDHRGNLEAFAALIAGAATEDGPTGSADDINTEAFALHLHSTVLVEGLVPNLPTVRLSKGQLILTRFWRGNVVQLPLILECENNRAQSQQQQQSQGGCECSSDEQRRQQVQASSQDFMFGPWRIPQGKSLVINGAIQFSCSL